MYKAQLLKPQLNMADQLLEQVREYAEGQIVSSTPPILKKKKEKIRKLIWTRRTLRVRNWPS